MIELYVYQNARCNNKKYLLEIVLKAVGVFCRIVVRKAKCCVTQCQLNRHKHATLTSVVKIIIGSNGRQFEVRNPETLQLPFSIEPRLLPYLFVLSHLIIFEYAKNRTVLAATLFLYLLSQLPINLCYIQLWDLNLEWKKNQ